jgi:drug/metabolite transporter (DMT)-like permease
MSPRGWLVVAYVALLPSIVAQMTYAQGVELIGPNRGSLFINLIPVFGALLAVLMLGERLETFHLIAAAFIIAGIGLAEYAARRNLKQILKPQ